MENLIFYVSRVTGIYPKYIYIENNKIINIETNKVIGIVENNKIKFENIVDK